MRTYLARRCISPQASTKLAWRPKRILIAGNRHSSLLSATTAPTQAQTWYECVGALLARTRSLVPWASLHRDPSFQPVIDSVLGLERQFGPYGQSRHRRRFEVAHDSAVAHCRSRNTLRRHCDGFCFPVPASVATRRHRRDIGRNAELRYLLGWSGSGVREPGRHWAAPERRDLRRCSRLRWCPGTFSRRGEEDFRCTMKS